MKKMQVLTIVITVVLLGGFLSACENGDAKQIEYDNPVVKQRADPFVYRTDGGFYYMVATVPEYDRLEIRKSETINGLSEAKPKVLWTKHDEGAMGYHIWAPELHRIDEKWYIYFAAGDADDVWKIRMYAISNESENPMEGEWVEEGRIVTQRNEFALDATTFEHRGERYMVWAERASDTEINTGLILAKMDSPTTVAGPEVVITQPEYDWERIGHNVNEGAAVLVRNGKVFISYSASATDDNYAIGLLWADADADLLDPDSWNKSEEPVFATHEEFKRFGPGHNSFTVAEDGETDVMIYHARNYREIDGEPLYDPNRHTRARVITWTGDGFPDFRHDEED